MNFVYLFLLAASWVGIECYIGGTRLLYSLPAYGVIAVCAVLSIVSIRSKRLPPNVFCLLSTLLLGGWVLWRALHSPVAYLALPDFFMMIGCLMVYLVTAYYFTGTRDRTILIVVLWGIAAAEVWVAMIQFLKNPQFMLFGLLRPTTERASGMYISPNNLAGFLVMVAIISISMGVWSRWPSWAKILCFYFAVCCLLGAAITGSRGGYFDTMGSLLCFAVGSIYTIRAADPRRYVPVLIGTICGVAAVIGIAIFLMGHSDLLDRRMHMMVVKDVRIYNWEAALDHIRVSPWVGTGSGTHLIYGRLFRRPQIQADPVHAHCDYLELLAEYGIVGGACMALFLTAHGVNSLRAFSELLRRRLIPSGLYRSNAFALNLGAMCAVVGLAIHSVVDFDMHIPGNALIFAFIFGMLANPETERQPGFVERRIVPWGRLIAPALGVVMLCRGVPLIPSEYYAEMSRRSLRDRDFLKSIAYAEKSIGPSSIGLVTPGVLTSQVEASGTSAALIDRMLARTGPNPNNPDTYFYIGESSRAVAMRMRNPYIRKHYFERALPAFEAGLRIFPQDESMLVRYGQALDGSGRFADAEGIYHRASEWDSKSSAVEEAYESHLKAEGKEAEAEVRAKAWQEAMPKAVDTVPSGDVRLQ